VAAVADPRHDDPTHQRVASRDQSGKPAQRPDDDPLTYDQIRALVAANNHSGQSDELIIAMAYKESRFRPNAQNLHSTVGGLLGLTDQAIEDVQTYFGANRDIDRHNPAQDIDAGSRYLALLISRAHGDVPQALARYGTGRAYATAVMKTASALKAGSPNPMQVLRQYIGKP
jgi:membrane-bound lytic murein transglycosylase MltF